MGDEFRIEDIWIILKRRIWHFMIPSVLVAALGLGTVMVLPAMYTTQGTILVESQQIPEQLIQSTISTYAQERIQVIRQRVMTRERLLSIADKYDLFPARLNLSSSEIVERMRNNLQVGLISVEQRSRGQDATIAFNVSYTDRSPDKAYLVANEFITLFLTEDVRARRDGASETTEFFDEEVQRIRVNLEDLESRIAAFKQENASALPEHLSLHMNQLERALQERASSENQILLIEEERQALETQLASYLAGASSPDGPAQELSAMKAQLAALRAEKTEEHPDVRALRGQIAALERQLAPSPAVTRLSAAIDAAQSAFARAQEGGDADATEAARNDLQRARDALSDHLIREASNNTSDFLVAQLQGRLKTVNTRLAGLRSELEELESQVSDLRDRIARTPAVERGLTVLARDLEQWQLQYREIQSKRQFAVTAEKLEDNQKAEKFSILEPAVKPEEPSSPDRPKLAVLALFLALGAGGASAGFAELAFATIRGRDHLGALLGEPPIAVIPVIAVARDNKSSLLKPRNPLSRAA